MTGSVLIQHDKSIPHKWLGGNRGTHWIVAGIVAVIVLGSYLIHVCRPTNVGSDGSRTACTAHNGKVK
jgi:hypothetical protein